MHRQIAQKTFKSKIEAHPVNAGHYMAFKHCISFATNLAASFGCYRFRITPDIVCRLLRAAIWSRWAVWYKSLSRRPFLRQVVESDLLLCTGFYPEHAVLFLCHIVTQRPMTDREIERSDGRCFGYKAALKPCWLLNWVSIARVVACFPQASLSRPAATAADSETTPSVCAGPSDPRKQRRRAAPRG